MTTNKVSTNKTKINHAGWLAIVVLALLALSFMGLAIRPLTGQPIAAASVVTAQPTWTPVPSITPAPSATLLPGGWKQETGLNGQVNFVPGPEDKQKILSAFNAVWDCIYAEDTTNDALAHLPGKKELCDAARQNSSGGIVPLFDSNIREITKFGSINPVTCKGFSSCEVARAKLGNLGVIGYDTQMCSKKVIPCVVRANAPTDPYQIIIVTLSRMEDGTWKATNYQGEKLPGPPPSQ